MLGSVGVEHAPFPSKPENGIEVKCKLNGQQSFLVYIYIYIVPIHVKEASSCEMHLTRQTRLRNQIYNSFPQYLLLFLDIHLRQAHVPRAQRNLDS